MGSTILWSAIDSLSSSHFHQPKRIEVLPLTRILKIDYCMLQVDRVERDQTPFWPPPINNQTSRIAKRIIDARGKWLS
jgi:hypothetical protein